MRKRSEIRIMREIVEVLKSGFPERTKIGGSCGDATGYALENGTIWHIGRLLKSWKNGSRISGV